MVHLRQRAFNSRVNGKCEKFLFCVGRKQKCQGAHRQQGSKGEHPCENRSLATATSAQVNTVKNWKILASISTTTTLHALLVHQVFHEHIPLPSSAWIRREIRELRSCLCYTGQFFMLTWKAILHCRNTCLHWAKGCHRNLSDMWGYTVKIETARYHYVTESAPKSLFSCVKRKPNYIREGFRAGARALQYSIDIKP